MKRILLFCLGCILAPAALLSQSENWFINTTDSIIKGNQMRYRGAYDSANVMYDMVHPGDTNYYWSFHEKTVSTSQSKNYEETLKLARQGLTFKSNYDLEFTMILANTMDELGRSSEASALYDSAIAVYPGSNLLHYNRAIAHLKQKRYEEGVNDLKKAIELNPMDPLSHYKLGSLALNNGNFTQALMSIGYVFMADPVSGRTNSMLQAFNSALSEKTDFEPIDYNFDPDKIFSKSDRLIKSYAALTDKYEIDSEVSFPLAKQMHLALNQAVKTNGKIDFWSLYYLPYYKQLLENELFEPYSYLMAANISTEYYQAMISDNIDDIQELITANQAFLADHHGNHFKGYVPGAEMLNFFFFDGVDGLYARGKLNEAGEPEGPYEFYYATGEISGKGSFNAAGEREGPFTFYHLNGKVKQTVNYKSGNYEGEGKEYFENGAPYLFSHYTEGDLNGKANLHYSHGAVNRKFNFVDGVPQDTIYYYHSNGNLSGKIPNVDGEANGRAYFFHEDGSKLSEVNFTNDNRTGPAEFYWPNGELDQKVTYNENGEYSGTLSSYHSNGVLHEEGQYLNGIRIGDWKTFNATGTLAKEESFDESGKKTGTEIFYDGQGRKEAMYQYKKEELVYFEIYNLAGEVQNSGKAKRGSLNYKAYSLSGVLTSEGVFNETFRIGEWREYDKYGLLDRQISYNDEGQVNGILTEYYNAEESPLYSTYSYRNDTLHGPYKNYFIDGSLRSEGIYYQGESEQLLKIYHPNGTLQEETYLNAGWRNGPSINYDPEGIIDRITHYKEGTIIATESYQNNKMVKRFECPDPLQPAILSFPNGQLRYKINRTGRRFNGPAQWYFGNGQLEVEGQYIEGQRDGNWTYYFPNGQVKQSGSFRIDQRVGAWKHYFKNGSLKQVYYYLEGALHGPNLEYDRNGNRVDSLNYLIGALHGDRYFYATDGKLQHIRVYDLGKIIGYRNLNSDGSPGAFVKIENGSYKVEATYPNGKPSRSYELVKGELKGNYICFFDNGQKASEFVYSKNELDGPWIEYFPNGQIAVSATYKNGFLEGLWQEFNSDGTLSYEANYLAGLKHGLVRYYTDGGKLDAEYTFISDELYE